MALMNSADIYATNINLQATYSTFDLYLKENFTKLGNITSNMLGRHNVLNTIAAIAVALDLGISFETIAHAIASFQGIERRFCYKGLFKEQRFLMIMGIIRWKSKTLFLLQKGGQRIN